MFSRDYKLMLNNVVENEDCGPDRKLRSVIRVVQPPEILIQNIHF